MIVTVLFVIGVVWLAAGFWKVIRHTTFVPRTDFDRLGEDMEKEFWTWIKLVLLWPFWRVQNPISTTTKGEGG